MTASTLQAEIVQSFSKSKDYCKFLGILIDGNMKFCKHVRCIRLKPAKHSDIKERYYAPRSYLSKLHFCNVISIVQYGILVYECNPFNVLETILSLQRIKLQIIFLKQTIECILSFWEHESSRSASALCLWTQNFRVQIGHQNFQP